MPEPRQRSARIAYGPPMVAISRRLRALSLGMLTCVTVALAATFLAEHYGGPAILFALLLGMAFHFLSEQARTGPGIRFTASTVLRFGVALLGARISVEQVAALGWSVALAVVVAVIATIGFGLLAGRLLGRDWSFGVLTGGAVAICGASAAVAIASVLPAHERAERHLTFTIIAVTSLSTIAMVVYPLIVSALDLDERAAGFFLGSSIHDVAQVLGAGYAMSETVGDNATLVKLMRVSMLLPVVFTVSWIARQGGRRESKTQRPYFLLGFAAIAALNSSGAISEELRFVLSEVSRWCIVSAIAAVGMRTLLGKVFTVGSTAVLLVVLETLFLALLMLGVAIGPGNLLQ